MEYQLVLQLPVLTTADFDEMIRLEGLIGDGLGDLGIVDGHDAGSGEGNIFIDTTDPRTAFARLQALPGVRECMGKMRVAYRRFEEESFTAIHPDGLTHFEVA